MNLIIEGSPDYTPKYDAKQNKLRDLSWDELKQSYGKGKKIICPCFKREYIINSTFISSHIQSQRHKKWIDNEQNIYIKDIGHCSDIESQIDILYKQQREHKVMYHNLCESKKECDIKIEDINNKNIILTREIEVLKKEKMEKNKIYNKNYNNKQIKYETEINIILTEIKELEAEKASSSVNENNIIVKPKSQDTIEQKSSRFKAKNILTNFRLR